VVKVDRVVTGIGSITSIGGPIYVSPFNPGVVKAVLVKPGERVKKGQALATLEPAFTDADVLQLRQHLQSDQAQIARDEAEAAERPYAPKEPNQYEALQLSLWRQRQADYHANVSNFDAQILASDALIHQYQNDEVDYAKRLKLASDVEQMYQPLLSSGYVSKLQWMGANDNRVEIDRLMTDAVNQVAGQQQTMAALKAQRDAYIKQWHADVQSDLVNVRNDLDTTQSSLDKAAKLSELVTLQSPADAIVLRIGKISGGSVAVAPSDPIVDPLFTLTPLDAPLEVTLDVQSMDVSFIQPGDPVTVKLDAYLYLEHGTAEGVVKTVSDGSFTLDDNNTPVPPYYKVTARITKLKLVKVPEDFALTPGLTLTGDIIVGRRTIFMYIMQSALRISDEALREPQ
jgi:HlyD family type I secretion membrane fusion protein